MGKKALMCIAEFCLVAGTSVSIVSTVIPYWLVYDSQDHRFSSANGRMNMNIGLWKMCTYPTPGFCVDHPKPDDHEKTVRAFMIMTNIMAALATLLGFYYIANAFNANNSTNNVASTNPGTITNPNTNNSSRRSSSIAIFILGFLAMGSSITAAIVYTVHYWDDIYDLTVGYQIKYGSAFYLNGVGTTAFFLGAIMFFIDANAWKPTRTATTVVHPPIMHVQTVQGPHPQQASVQPTYGQPVLVAQPVIYGQQVVYSQPAYGQPVVYLNPPPGQPSYPAQPIQQPSVVATSTANQATGQQLGPPPAYQQTVALPAKNSG